jgi:phosphopantothenoylcysteine decarboxylase/phosphopantothenate--cysteine ligase
MARILLGVSGGIAAYKALELVRLTTGAGHSVRVIQTPSSRRFVGPASFEALTGAPVLVSEFDHDPFRGAFPGEQPPAHEPIGHLEIVAKADLLLIAPASANTIAKLAHGHAEGMLSTAALAARCPLVIAPAMNSHMYEHPATQANLDLLRARGAHVIEPESGRLASKGEQGIGRLPDPTALLATAQEILAEAAPPRQDGSWSGLKVLVTAGGTREPIDGVRFVGNTSSGKMGLALAQAAAARGAQVSVIAANVALPRPAGVQWIEAPTASAMQRACEQQMPGCDVLLMAAAIADFRPAHPVNGKIKKRELQSLTLELEPTPDVLGGLAAARTDGQTLVGFAAEHGDQGLAYARAKLAEKHLDAIVLNDISRSDIGFAAAENEVTVIAAAWEQSIAKAAKRTVADGILDAVARLRAP